MRGLVGRSEMRKQLLNGFLPLLVLALVAAANAQSSTPAKRSALLKVQVSPSADGINLELATRGEVQPRVSQLSSPARLVVDLPDTVAASVPTISVDQDGVKEVRVGMDGQTPPTTRVVVDLDKMCRYELVPGADNRMVLKLYTGHTAEQASAQPSAAPVSDAESEEGGSGGAGCRKAGASASRHGERARPLCLGQGFCFRGAFV